MAADDRPFASAVDRRQDCGPFDIIGDVHGCAAELVSLLETLGYRVRWPSARGGEVCVTPPAGRKAVFVGDLVDRGPRSPDVLRLVMHMHRRGAAYAVMGNHDLRLLEWLVRPDMVPRHGLEETVRQLAHGCDDILPRLRAFLEALPSHHVFDGGRLVVAHAGILEPMIGRDTYEVDRFTLLGRSTAALDPLPGSESEAWPANYRGTAAVVHGHRARGRTEWCNNSLCIDTGCVYGGKLTALRWPERDLVDVPALRAWHAPPPHLCFIPPLNQ